MSIGAEDGSARKDGDGFKAFLLVQNADSLYNEHERGLRSLLTGQVHDWGLRRHIPF